MNFRLAGSKRGRLRRQEGGWKRKGYWRIRHPGQVRLGGISRLIDLVGKIARGRRNDRNGLEWSIPKVALPGAVRGAFMSL